jgi:glycosyltransferase involved in cell wall biosynthesis
MKRDQLKKLERPSRSFNTPLRILVEGWFYIPHSYAIVCCNEILALKRVYKNEIEIYIKEEQYFRESWEELKQKGLKYTDSKNILIKEFKIWNGEDIDLVYRISYPYNLELKNYGKYAGRNIPTVVFYTAEFSSLDPHYFKFNDNFKFVDDSFIENFVNNYKNFHFKTCAKWCESGMKKYTDDDRCKTITLGVDPSVYYKDQSKRKELRESWGFKDTDIVLMNGGSMTRNKGVPEILATLSIVVFSHNQSHVKLLLKGTQDLYGSRRLVESYLDDLIREKVMTKENTKILLDNHIKFIETSVSEGSLRHLYNAVDLYISPYLAEGFNMMVLESIACGTKVLVSRGGATDDFIDNLMSIKDASKYLYRFDTEVMEGTSGKQLSFSIQNILEKLGVIDFKYNSKEYEIGLKKMISKKYSWESIAKEIYEYFINIVDTIGEVCEYNKTGINKKEIPGEIDMNSEIKATIKQFIREN